MELIIEVAVDIIKESFLNHRPTLLTSIPQTYRHIRSGRIRKVNILESNFSTAFIRGLSFFRKDVNFGNAVNNFKNFRPCNFCIRE